MVLDERPTGIAQGVRPRAAHTEPRAFDDFGGPLMPRADAKVDPAHTPGTDRACWTTASRSSEAIVGRFVLTSEISHLCEHLTYRARYKAHCTGEPLSKRTDDHWFWRTRLVTSGFGLRHSSGMPFLSRSVDRPAAMSQVSISPFSLQSGETG